MHVFLGYLLITVTVVFGVMWLWDDCEKEKPEAGEVLRDQLRALAAHVAAWWPLSPSERRFQRRNGRTKPLVQQTDQLRAYEVAEAKAEAADELVRQLKARLAAQASKPHRPEHGSRHAEAQRLADLEDEAGTESERRDVQRAREEDLCWKWAELDWELHS